MKQSLALDIPDISPLEQLLGTLSSKGSAADKPSPMGGTMQKPAIGKVEKSSLLGKLKQFLPELEKANQKLEAEMAVHPAESFDIENVHEGEAHIEMDLACGVIDLKDKAAETAAEKAIACGSGREEAACEDDSDDSSSDDDEETEGKEKSLTEVKVDGGKKGGKRKLGITEL